MSLLKIIGILILLESVDLVKELIGLLKDMWRARK